MRYVDDPLYESAPTENSMGNVYAIFSDRIELKFRFPFITKILVVKSDDFTSIDAFKPPVVRTTFRALKLDLADLKEHVGIKKKNGIFKQLRFTPEDPKEFVRKAKEILDLNC